MEQYGATDAWKGEFNYLPLNPDNKFKVLTHRRMVLIPRNDGNYMQRSKKGSAWMAPNKWNIKRYYKVGKAMSIEDDDALEPQKNIYEIFWYNTENADRFPANPIQTSYLDTQRRNVVYYSDTT